MTSKGPQGVALNKERFCHFLHQILVMAGYSKSATIHNIHRVLGQKTEGKAITLIYLRKLCSQRSQGNMVLHLCHRSTRTEVQELIWNTIRHIAHQLIQLAMCRVRRKRPII